MNIAILYAEWEEDEEEEAPPVEAPAPKRRKGKKPRKAAPAPTLDREDVFEALTKLGHEPSYHVIDGGNKTLLALAKSDADLIFNLTESYGGDDTKDMNIAAYLDLIGKKYTGAGPHGLYLAQDKSLAKKIFAFHGIQSPIFAVSYKGQLDHAHDITFPLIVKPLSEDGSVGIDSGAVVTSVKELMERMQLIQDDYDSPALIEAYIEGREIYAAVLGGGQKPEALPLIELDLSKLPKGTPKIAGTEVKWEEGTEAYEKTRSQLAEDLDADTTERLQQTAVAAYQACKLRDYGRIDMRLTPKGEIYVIEANPNPWLSAGAEVAMAAKAAGKSYPELIGSIVEMALARYA